MSFKCTTIRLKIAQRHCRQKADNTTLDDGEKQQLPVTYLLQSLQTDSSLHRQSTSVTSLTARTIRNERECTAYTEKPYENSA